MENNTMACELPDVGGCDLTPQEMKVNAARTEMISCISSVYSKLGKDNVNRLEKQENLTLVFDGNVLEILGGIDTIRVQDDSYQGVCLGQQFNKAIHFPYSFLRHLNLI